MHIMIATGDTPFKWNGKFYKITKAGILSSGEVYAETEPSETELEEELKRRIDRDRHLHVYLESGYVCFPEDHGKD